MVKYTFLVKIEDETITTITELGKDFRDCCHALDVRLLTVLLFTSYEVLSVHKAF